MAHLNVAFDFDSAAESSDGTGWRVVHWLDDGTGSGNFVLTEDRYDTITNALNAVEELFSSDPEVDQYFHDMAVTSVVNTNAAAVATEQSNLRTADGLDATTA